MPINFLKDLLTKTDKSKINLTPDQLQAELLDTNTVLVDIRESEELLSSGRIQGSINVSFGSLRSAADKKHPKYNHQFDVNNRIILYCTSGGRSSAALVLLKHLGFKNLAHLDGGLVAWRESGKNVM